MNKRKQKSSIISRLIEQGISQKKLAMELNVSNQSVHNVICGKSRSKRIEQKINSLTGFVFEPNLRVPRGYYKEG